MKKEKKSQFFFKKKESYRTHISVQVESKTGKDGFKGDSCEIPYTGIKFSKHRMRLYKRTYIHTHTHAYENWNVKFAG